MLDLCSTMHYIVMHMVGNKGRGMKRDNAITVRLSDAERRALDGAAQNEDVPVAQIIRRAIKKELERIQPEHSKSKSPGGQKV
jgi:hypothetical protein